MGIFSKWALFAKTEAILEKKLQENPFYPFKELDSTSAFGNSDSLHPWQEAKVTTVYVYSTRFKRFYLALFLSVTSLLFTIIWPSAGGDREYLVFTVAALLLSVYLALEYGHGRTVLLDPATEHYSVYRGKMLIATQHLHNFYIRLICSNTTSRHPTYQLVMDGWGLELPIKLTGETTNRKKLRHLAHELSASLHINYFDVHNTSKHHIIRHNRPHNAEAPIDPHEE